jgi:hypothetical protein
MSYDINMVGQLKILLFSNFFSHHMQIEDGTSSTGELVNNLTSALNKLG